jgi:alpha-L-fucosidase
VREFWLEGLAAGQWIPLGAGTAIGHKRIQPIAALRLEAIRLDVTRSVGTPRIRRVAAFATGATPPATWSNPGPR